MVKRIPALALTGLLSIGLLGLLLAGWLPAGETLVEPVPPGEQQVEAMPLLPTDSAAVSAEAASPAVHRMVPESLLEERLAREEDLPPPVDVGPTSPLSSALPQPEPAPAVENPCDRPPQPLPPPGVAGATEFWQTFRAPLPPTSAWNPPGPKRVGLQAGHWRIEEAPQELSRLGHGATGGGRAEWQVNLDLARRTAELLEREGVEADVLPATVPASYRAHAFLSIHADGDEKGALRGYKLARAAFSAAPEVDDRLVATLYDAYGKATGLPRDDLHITRRMTAYYAFNSRRYCHAVAPGVPAAILEAGFLTSAADRQLLLGNPDTAAAGIALGLLRYLGLAD
jgi:hypothetical protein